MKERRPIRPAGPTGFEPVRTESKSVGLPLPHGPINFSIINITDLEKKCQGFLKIFYFFNQVTNLSVLPNPFLHYLQTQVRQANHNKP